MSACHRGMTLRLLEKAASRHGAPAYTRPGVLGDEAGSRGTRCRVGPGRVVRNGGEQRPVFL